MTIHRILGLRCAALVALEQTPAGISICRLLPGLVLTDPI